MSTDLSSQNDDAIYVEAYQELESESPHVATWAKALAESGGNKAMAKSTYLRLRVEGLKADKVVAPTDHMASSVLIKKPKLNNKWLIAGLIVLPLIVGGIYFTGKRADNSKSQNEASQQIDGYEILPSGDEILDPKTNLVWKRCSVGQAWDGATCNGEVESHRYEDAQKLAPEGWRIPTVRELASLIYCSSESTQSETDPDGKGNIKHSCDGNYSTPTIRTSAFPQTLDFGYWSASPYVGKPALHWTIGFSLGNLYDGMSDAQYRVRYVRDHHVVQQKIAQQSLEKLKVSPSAQPNQMFNDQSKPAEIPNRFGQVQGLNPKGDGFLAVRAEPSSNATEVAKLYEGDRVRILQEENDWVQLELPNKNLRGWSHKKWISINSNATKDKATDWPYGLPVKMEEKDGWGAQIDLTCLDVDKACATIDYKALNCGGGWVYKGNKNNLYEFEQVLLYGNCVKGCQVVLDASKKTYTERCPTGTSSESGTLFIETD